jgi:hypothetical protein
VGKAVIEATASYRSQKMAATAQVSVRNNFDVGGLMGSLALPLLLVALAVVALVAAGMMVRRRRRQKAQASGDYWATYR